MNSSVFLSYARADGLDAVNSLSVLLKEQGVSAWQDLRELDPDGTVWPQIEQALKSAGHLIVVITPAALTSDYVRREWREARANGASVLPVMGADMKRGDLPRWVRRGEVYRLDEPAHMEKFVAKLRAPGKTFCAEWQRGLEIEAFVDRPNLVRDIKRQLLAEDGTPVGLSSALHGQGGFGKTVLAGTIARDPEIRDAFLDGVFWVEIGQENPNILTHLNALCQRIGGRADAIDVNTAAEDLARLLEKRDVLLIVDDVWRSQDLSPFVKAVGAGQAALLTTTRVAASLPRRFTPIEVSEMEPDEALAVLARDLDPSPTDQKTLEDFADEFWFWPQLLAISNGILLGRIEDGQPLTDAVQTLARTIRSGRVPGEDERARTIHAVMDIGLGTLTDEERARFRHLAVVPEDTPVPIWLFAPLWDMDLFEAEEFAGRLLRLGLLQSRDLSGAPEQRTLRLHDNMHWFLRTQTEEPERRSMHAALLDRHKPATGHWSDLPASSSYLWQHLLTHLQEAGRQAERAALQTDFAWIRGKLNVCGANALVSDDRFADASASSDAVGRTLLLSLPALRKTPEDLGWQLFGRLGARSDLNLAALTQQALSAIPEVVPVTAKLIPPGPLRMRIPAAGASGCVAFSPDGTRLLSGGYDGTLRLWDAQTGAQIGEPLRGHEDWVNSVGFSPDGQRLLSGGGDGTLRLWDAQTGAQIGAPLTGHKDWVRSVAFSPDGTRLLSGGDDRTLRLWDAQTGAQIGAPLRGHGGWVLSVAFSPDGTRLLSGGRDRTLRLWDAQTGAQIGEPLRGHEGWVRSVAFSPDGTRLLSGGDDDTLRLWDARTGAQIGEPLRGHQDRVTSVAFSPDGTRLLSGGDDSTLRLWDAKTGAQIGEPLRGHERRVLSVAFSPDGTRLLSGGIDSTLRLWDASTGVQTGAPLRGHEDAVRSVVFSPDGQRLLSGGDDSTLRLWDAATGVQIGEPLRGHQDRVTSVAFSPDGQRLLSGGDDSTLRLWDAKTGAQIGEPLRGHERRVRSVAFSPDGTRLLSGGVDGTLRLWDAQTGAQIGAPLRGHEDVVTSVAFSPDGQRLLSGGGDRTLRLWDAQTGAQIGAPLRGHESAVLSVAFSPDGTRLLSGGYDRTLRLWDAQTGAQIGEPLRGHEGWVRSVAFSPDGTRLLSGSDDGTLRLWDAHSCSCKAVLHFDSGLTSLASSPTHLAVADSGGHIHFFRWRHKTD